MEHLPQDAAGLATALLWSFSALAWSFAARRVGSVPVAAIRILLAALALITVHWVAFGAPWPTSLHAETLILLIASGTLGVAAADLLLFRGLLLIGPRLGMLLLSLSPILSSLIALLLMGETLGLQAIAGILLTVAGIAWVLAERRSRRAWRTTRRAFRAGVLLCLSAAVIVSASYVLSRMAMLPGPPRFLSGPPRPGAAPFDAAVVRVIAGAVATWLALPLMRRTTATLGGFADRRAMLTIALGTVAGPIVGIWMSMIALEGAKSGIAVALINTSPLMLIPIAYVAYRERPTLRTVGGTALAMAGVFLLVLR